MLVSALGLLVAFLFFAQLMGTLRQPWAVCSGASVGIAALPFFSAVFCLAVLPLLWLCLLVRARLVARFWLLLPAPHLWSVSRASATPGSATG